MSQDYFIFYFLFLGNRRVSEYIPKLIISKYLSLIPWIARHWFVLNLRIEPLNGYNPC
jgi:hypothetical protein